MKNSHFSGGINIVLHKTKFGVNGSKAGGLAG